MCAPGDPLTLVFWKKDGGDNSSKLGEVVADGGRGIAAGQDNWRLPGYPDPTTPHRIQPSLPRQREGSASEFGANSE